MKLKKYIKGLQKLAKEHPEALEMQVVTSGDDEGNSFNSVHYSPSLGRFEDREFSQKDHLDECDAVCVN